MKRRLIIAAGALALAVVIPGTGFAVAPTSAFTGTWESTDFDGSHQTLLVSAGARPSVVYQDFYASSCDTFAGPSTHWVASGVGEVDGDILWISFHKSGCGNFLQGGYDDWYWYDSGTDTLTDSVGIIWTRTS